MAPPPGVGSLDAVAATKSLTFCSTNFISIPHVKEITRGTLLSPYNYYKTVTVKTINAITLIKIRRKG